MTYKEQRTALLAYLHMKVETEDWHAVADAAMDLREMEARASPFDELLKKMCRPALDVSEETATPMVPSFLERKDTP